MNSKNVISVFLASLLTTGLIVTSAAMGVPDQDGFIYAFKVIPVLKNTVNSDGTFVITYLPQTIILFLIVTLMYSIITLLVQKRKKVQAQNGL